MRANSTGKTRPGHADAASVRAAEACSALHEAASAADGIAYDALCALAADLPAVAASTSYGTPALKVAGKLMLRLIDDGATIALRCGWDERERLLAVSPDVFFVTAHYQAYPWVLVRLGQLAPEAAPALLDMAWQLAAPAMLKRQRPAG